MNFDDMFTTEVLKDDVWHIVGQHTTFNAAVEDFRKLVQNNEYDQVRLYSPKFA